MRELAARAMALRLWPGRVTDIAYGVDGTLDVLLHSPKEIGASVPSEYPVTDKDWERLGDLLGSMG